MDIQDNKSYCQKKKEKREWTERKATTSYTRKCHDCGEPTNDYRCSKCWEKYRKPYLFYSAGGGLDYYDD